MAKRVDEGRTLTWLHISDLHFEPTGNFDRTSVLEGMHKLVESYGRDGTFKPDLVFVTGDVANRGADKEYDEAGKFFDKLLHKLSLERERLFVVPGNHDIDRTQGWLLARTLANEEESDDFFSNAARSHEKHLAKLRAFREWHARYFKGVRDTDAFSACAPPTTVAVRGLRVAVLSLNSATFCLDDSDHNKLWVGRSWLHHAVSTIDHNADLRVALMHHPIDWLHDEERGQIKSELAEHVDVVLRGHLHDNEAEAAASATQHVVHLAAGATWQAPRWPKRALLVQVQFDTATLRVHPICYQKDPHRKWTLDTSVFATPDYEGTFALRRLEAAMPRRPSPLRSGIDESGAGSVKVHRRHWLVGPDGISEVRVVLEEVDCDGGVILALPEPPFCHIVADENATTTASPIKVERDEVAPGLPRFRIPGRVHERRCAWTYTVSNALALDRHDAQLLHAPAPHHGELPRGISGRPHTVLCRYGRFEIQYEFEGVADVETMVESPHAIVERMVDGQGHARWTRDPDEERRCVVAVSPDKKSIVLSVDDPIYKHRYTLAYTPRRLGFPPKVDGIHAAKALLDSCRGARHGADPLVRDLSRALDTACQNVGCVPPGGQSSATGFVWNPERALLLPCFGRFTNQGWSARFQYGNGVAGQALRFAKVAAWIRGADRARSVIFQEKTDAASSYTYAYRWIVSVPLLADVQGPALGIVSFASPVTETSGDRWFEDIALDASGDAAAIARAKAKTDLLVLHVNAEFWGALRTSSHAPTSLQVFAGEVLSRLAASTRSSAPPAPIPTLTSGVRYDIRNPSGTVSTYPKGSSQSFHCVRAPGCELRPHGIRIRACTRPDCDPRAEANRGAVVFEADLPNDADSVVVELGAAFQEGTRYRWVIWYVDPDGRELASDYRVFTVVA